MGKLQAKNQTEEELLMDLDDEEEVDEDEEDEEDVDNNEPSAPSTPSETTTETPLVMQDLDDIGAPKERKVKIKVKKEHRCSIGGQWYHFYPGKEYPVPQHVKDVLRNANVLDAI